MKNRGIYKNWVGNRQQGNISFLPREGKNASPRGMPFSLALPQPTLLTLPPYFLLSLFRYIPLSVETLRATSQFGYVRDACTVSVWIACGDVGDVARYVSTGWMWVDVFSWKLLRFLKLRVIFALKTAKIGCTSAKHASKLDAFAFGLHYLCREQNKEEL